VSDDITAASPLFGLFGGGGLVGISRESGPPKGNFLVPATHNAAAETPYRTARNNNNTGLQLSGPVAAAAVPSQITMSAVQHTVADCHSLDVQRFQKCEPFCRKASYPASIEQSKDTTTCVERCCCRSPLNLAGVSTTLIKTSLVVPSLWAAAT